MAAINGIVKFWISEISFCAHITAPHLISPPPSSLPPPQHSLYHFNIPRNAVTIPFLLLHLTIKVENMPKPKDYVLVIFVMWMSLFTT